MITPLSKVIDINFNLNETSKTLLANAATGKQFNTADTDAWFEFGFTDANIQSGTYNLTLINLKDESKFEHEGIAFNSNPFYYKLDSGADMLTNEIKHAGTWIGQLVVTLDNGKTGTQKFVFDIENHILDGTVASVTMLEGYSVLMAQIENAKELLDQYNIDYAALLADLEATYNSRLFSVEQQLADKAEQAALLVERARIDNLSTMAEGSTTGDADLMDGRVGADGIIYPNIGGAIRGQLTSVNNKIDELEDADVQKLTLTLVENTALLMPSKIIDKPYYIKSNSKVYGARDNIFKAKDTPPTTVDGVTYSIVDGVITLNGTSSSNGENLHSITFDFESFLNDQFIGKYIYFNVVFGESLGDKGYLVLPYKTASTSGFGGTTKICEKITSRGSSKPELFFYNAQTFVDVTISIQAVVLEKYQPQYTFSSLALEEIPTQSSVLLNGYTSVFTHDGTPFEVYTAKEYEMDYVKTKLAENEVINKEPFNLIENKGLPYNMFGHAVTTTPSANGKVENVEIDGITGVKYSTISAYDIDSTYHKSFDPIDLSAEDFMIRVYISPETYQNFNRFEFGLSDKDDLASYWGSYVTLSVMRHEVAIGWNFLKFKLSDRTPTVGTPDYSKIKFLRLRLFNLDTTTPTSCVIANDIIVGSRLKACILVNFDDSASSMYENGFPYMKQKRIPGTIFLSNRSVRDKYDGVNVPLCMDFREHVETELSGWEIGMHSKTHNDIVDLLSTQSFDPQYADLRFNYDYILNNLMDKPLTFSAPNGKYNDYTVDALKYLKVKMLRSSASNQNYGFLKYRGVYTLMTKEIRSDTTLQQIKGFVDEAISRGGICSIFTHQINIGNTDAFSMELDLFKQYIDYVAQKRDEGLIKVMTFKELYDCLLYTYHG